MNEKDMLGSGTFASNGYEPKDFSERAVKLGGKSAMKGNERRKHANIEYLWS